MVGELPLLPHLPELPARGVGADLIGRTAALLVDLYTEVWPSGYRVAARPGRDHRRGVDLLRRDVDAFDDACAPTRPGWVKVQAAGPWTLAAGVELHTGHRVLTDRGAVREFAASLAEGLRVAPGRGGRPDRGRRAGAARRAVAARRAGRTAADLLGLRHRAAGVGAGRAGAVARADRRAGRAGRRALLRSQAAGPAAGRRGRRRAGPGRHPARGGRGHRRPRAAGRPGRGLGRRHPAAARAGAQPRPGPAADLPGAGPHRPSTWPTGSGSTGPGCPRWPCPPRPAAWPAPTRPGPAAR